MEKEAGLLIDNRSLETLIEESQDLQVDAIRSAHETLPDLADLRSDRGNTPPEPEKVRAFQQSRRDLLTKFGLGGGAIAARGLAATSIGAAVVAILSKPVSAQEDLDVTILNTASSLEILAIQTYDTAMKLPYIKDGNATILAFAKTTAQQHGEHSDAFNAQAQALGGSEQVQPNSQFAQVVSAAVPALETPLDVVKLAAQLEEVAADTYLSNLSMFSDKKSLSLMASVMGVEVQHLATLNAVRALLEADAPELVAIPTNLAKLPAAAGSAGFADGAFLTAQTETVAKPGVGTK